MILHRPPPTLTVPLDWRPRWVRLYVAGALIPGERSCQLAYELYQERPGLLDSPDLLTAADVFDELLSLLGDRAEIAG